MHSKYSKPKGRKVHLFAPRILQMLAFLTRKQAWLSPPEISQQFQLNNKPLSAMTIYRWFSYLEENVGLTYFPYPRMNMLDLADVYVRIRTPRNPQVLSGVPFGHSFLLEMGLDGRPFLSQNYWVPGSALKAFEDYWRTAKDLDLVEDAEVLQAKNTHFMFSPFHEVIREDGLADISGDVDNNHFEDLVRRHLEEPFKVELEEHIASSPILIPLLTEHLWRHCSSRHVWDSIRAKGEDEIANYVQGSRKGSLKKPGTVLRLLQQEWQGLMLRFDKTFLQPVVFFPPGLMMNSPLVSIHMDCGSNKRMLEMAFLTSQRSVSTALLPGVRGKGKCRIWCNSASEQLPFILRIMREHHRGKEEPVFGLIDLDGTRSLAQPEFCAFDWRSFDPKELSWRFEGEKYVERLKGIKVHHQPPLSPAVP